MTRPPAPLVSSALLLPLGLAAALRAAELPRRDDPLLAQGIRRAVQVTAMDLDVVATRDGRPVEDLTKEDFVVKVDGKPLALDYFTRVDAGTLHGPDLATASPDLVLETTAGDKGDRYLARQFVVYFDDVHLLPFERKHVLESLRDFLVRLTPSDRVMLLAYGGSSTRVVVPFTSSKEDLLDGLSKVDKIPPAGVRWDVDFKRTVNELQRTRTSSRGSVIRSWAAQVVNRERDTLEDLRRAVSALAARSGKRALIYVSNGLELRPGQTLSEALGPSTLQQFEYSVTDRLRQVTAEANRAGVTIHAIDARGLATDIDASESSPSPFSYFFTSETLREAMRALTSETGGLFLVNRNTYETGVDRIYRESTSYYSLGVTLATLDAKKGEHSVSVSCKRPGVQVRTRRTYGPKGAEEASRDRMEMALLTPGAKGDFPAELQIGPPEKGRIVPYEVLFPMSALTFTEEAGGQRQATFEVTLAAVTDRGARSNIRPDRQVIRFDAAQWGRAQDQKFRYAGKLKSEKGNLRYVATVRDVPSDRVAIATYSARID